MRDVLLTVAGLAFSLSGAQALADSQEVTPTGGSSDIRYFDGLVGIGETALGARFVVKGGGNTSATSASIIKNSSGTVILAVRDDKRIYLNGNYIQPSGAAEFVNDLTVASPLFVVDVSTSRVGIGRTDPLEALHVTGDIRTDTDMHVFQDLFLADFTSYIRDRSGSARIGIDDDGDVKIYNGSGAERVTVTAAGDVGINDYTPDYPLDVGGSAQIQGDLRIAGDCKATVSSFAIQDSNAVDRVTITAGGTLALKEDNGNVALVITTAGGVGIGTGLPAYPIDIADDTRIQGDLNVTGEVWATSYSTWSAYPEDVSTAYAAVQSIGRLPDGEYDPDDVHKQLDHSVLHDFVRNVDDTDRPGFNLSAAVGAQNEVIKSLIERIELLEEMAGVCQCE